MIHDLDLRQINYKLNNDWDSNVGVIHAYFEEHIK